ncbi:hypothetical protein BBJ28_00008558 [Nothophytophthora sp. Chile5]|nr:hypothetical protein BBJ28_00008558 [Nothophytophthora sp. Chile5]
MRALSCGSGGPPSTPRAIAVPAPVVKHRLAYETFLEKRASITEPSRAQSSKQVLTAAACGDSLRTVADQASCLELAMVSYDNLLAQVRPLEQPNSTDPALALPSTLMEIVRMPGPQKVVKRRSLGVAMLPNADLDEIEIPEAHEGFYRAFCQPNSWSPAFASPGDFTIKMASVFQDNGEVCFRIAVMCCCARSISDGARIKPVSKRQYYVNHVERSQQELAQLIEALSLQYMGHRLADKMPAHGSRLTTTRKQRVLDEYGEEVTQFLSYVMQITEIGFNRLVALKEPVANNVRLREFLDLSFGFGERTIVATSSCDARIEGQEGDGRPGLPSAWLDVDVNLSTDGTCSERFYSARRSPRDDVFARSFSRMYDSGTLSDLNHQYGSSTHRLSASKCVRFIAPCRWFDDVPCDGAFTVEISGVVVSDDSAKYAISVITYVGGRLEVSTIDRRYSEFDELALKIEAKVPTLQVRKLLPPKTFFRYYSASFLERRAASLQLFLERVLRLNFLGVLDQEIPLTAEPNIRAFLKLPSVEWIVVPWNKQSPNTKGTQESFRFRPSFSLTPTAPTEFSPLSPRYVGLSPVLGRNCGNGQKEATTPRYESLVSLKRSDSM